MVVFNREDVIFSSGQSQFHGSLPSSLRARELGPLGPSGIPGPPGPYGVDNRPGPSIASGIYASFIASASAFIHHL